MKSSGIIRFHKLLLPFVLAGVGVFHSSAFAGPGPDLLCQATSEPSVYSALFQKAVSGNLIWVTLSKNGSEVATIACAAEKVNESEKQYICKNGIDDRYHANPDNYRVRLIHYLAHDQSQAIVLPDGAPFARLDSCVPRWSR